MRVLLHPWVPSGKPVPIEGKLMLGSCDRTLSEEDVLDWLTGEAVDGWPYSSSRRSCTAAFPRRGVLGWFRSLLATALVNEF